MPKKPKHYCTTPKCPNFAESGESYCPECKKRKNREYNKTRPAPAVAYGPGVGYNRAWQVYRKWYLKRHPFCVECAKEGRTVLATIVDHILAVRKGGDFWEPTNHQSLCTSHHNSKTAKEDGGFGR